MNSKVDLDIVRRDIRLSRQAFDGTDKPLDLVVNVWIDQAQALLDEIDRLRADYERNAEAYGQRLAEADYVSSQCREALEASRDWAERMRVDNGQLAAENLDLREQVVKQEDELDKRRLAIETRNKEIERLRVENKNLQGEVQDSDHAELVQLRAENERLRALLDQYREVLIAAGVVDTRGDDMPSTTEILDADLALDGR